MDTMIYRYMNWTRDELRADAEAESAGLDPDKWSGGEFVFDDWLSDGLLTGHSERVDTDPSGQMIRPHTGRPGSLGEWVAPGRQSQRSYAPFTDEHLRRLVSIAEADQKSFFQCNPHLAVYGVTGAC